MSVGWSKQAVLFILMHSHHFFTSWTGLQSKFSVKYAEFTSIQLVVGASFTTWCFYWSVTQISPLQASAWIPRAPWMLVIWRTRKLHCRSHVCPNQSACETCPSACPATPTLPLPPCACLQLSQALFLICRIIVSAVGFKMAASFILGLADMSVWA